MGAEKNRRSDWRPVVHAPMGSTAMLRPGMLAVVALLAITCCLGTTIASAEAQTETSASIRPSLLPNRLGANTALTLAFRFSGGAEGVPAPLRGMVVHLPAGLNVNLRGARTCPPSRLQSRGAAGCSSKSLVGRGHALMRVHAGSLAVPEETSISIFRGPNRAAHQTLEIFSQGSTPLDESTTATGVLSSESGRFGSKLTVTVPAIPTLVLEPDASFVSLSLTIGGVGHAPRAHAAAGSITVPRSCPTTGFPFMAEFTFAGSAGTSALGTVACP
jgi:hypothetical protein